MLVDLFGFLISLLFWPGISLFSCQFLVDFKIFKNTLSIFFSLFRGRIGPDNIACS